MNPSRARVPEGATLTALDFLSHLIYSQRHRHPEDGADAIRRRFENGEVRLRDATPLAPEDILPPGADVWFYRTPAPETPVPYQVRILYEDDFLLVVDKPPFLATMPRGEHITETVTVRLRRSTGNNDLTPAHRLDRLTSGLLLLTKRPEVRGAYQELFASRRVTKTYQAVARYDSHLAHLCETSGLQWASHITKTPGDLQARVWPEREPNAYTTVLSVYRLPNSENAIYTLQPHTGKTHQLRIHMAQAGVPIQGDPLYPVVGSQPEDFHHRLRLQATSLHFTDPLTHQPRTFTTPASP